MHAGHTYSELKSVERVLVDLLQLLLHLDGEVDEVAAVSVLVALKKCDMHFFQLFVTIVFQP